VIIIFINQIHIYLTLSQMLLELAVDGCL